MVDGMAQVIELPRSGVPDQEAAGAAEKHRAYVEGQQGIRAKAEASLRTPYLYDGVYRMDLITPDVWLGSLKFNVRTERWSIEVDATNHADVRKMEPRAYAILLVACRLANEKWELGQEKARLYGQLKQVESVKLARV